MVKLTMILFVVRLSHRINANRLATWNDIRECRKTRVETWNQWRCEQAPKVTTIKQDATVEAAPIEQWALDHNSKLTAQSVRESWEHRHRRIRSIRRQQQFRKLERMAVKLIRRESSPVFRAPSTQCTMPLPAVRLASDDKRTLSAELLALLSTLRGEFRSEVESTCWIVQGDYPTADSGKVFRRACRIVRENARGIYRDNWRLRDQMKSVELSPAYDVAASLRYWQEQSEKLNRLERIELAVLIARTQAGREVVDAMLSGKSRKQIASELGINERTLHRRIAAIGTGEQVVWSNGRVFVRTGNN